MKPVTVTLKDSMEKSSCNSLIYFHGLKSIENNVYEQFYLPPNWKSTQKSFRKMDA